MGERMLGVNGTHLWVSDEGAGVPLVLCNGGPGCCDYLAPVAAMVDDVARVIRFEPRGCGRSDPDGPYDLATTLSDLDAIRATLGLEQWLVGGHSHGAFVALAYALEFPSRTRGVLYLAGTGVQNDRQWKEAYEAGKAAGRESELPMAYPPNMDVNRVGGASMKAYCREPDLLRRLANLDVPFLAVQGSRDIRPNWPVEQLVRLIPAARLTMIEGAGHYLWLTHAPELRQSIRAFAVGGDC